MRWVDGWTEVEGGGGVDSRRRRRAIKTARSNRVSITPCNATFVLDSRTQSIMYDFCISPIYATVLLGGGLYGFAAKGSVESLGALFSPRGGADARSASGACVLLCEIDSPVHRHTHEQKNKTFLSRRRADALADADGNTPKPNPKQKSTQPWAAAPRPRSPCSRTSP
jgi:hypothetical protein